MALNNSNPDGGEKLREQLCWLLTPSAFTEPSRVIAHPSAVPAVAGIYGWYFVRPALLLGDVPCHISSGHGLLYVGIAPGRPRTTARKGPPQTIRDRLTQHLNGTAERSTLRFSLGSLLRKSLGLRLEHSPSGKWKHWGTEGERELSRWMTSNSLIVWNEHPEPWELERGILAAHPMPFNLSHSRHPFGPRLKQARADSRRELRSRG